VTQEFHLSVTPIGRYQYLVRTEYPIPRGVPLAEEQVTWDIERWLKQTRQVMGDPVQGLLRGTSEDSGEANFSGRNALNLVELGQELFLGLFQGTLRDSWVIAQGVAQHRREALRLRLGLKGAELLRLPWEMMYGADVPVERLRQSGNITATPRPLVTGTRIIFSRYQSGIRLVEENLPALTDLAEPLRILMVVSSPDGQERLKLSREIKQMQQELAVQESEHELTPELTILNQPGREQLAQALEQGHFQVLHYAGHSDLSAEGGNLYLVNNRTGLTEILTGDDLAGLLVNNGIRLAVFNSCRGAYTADSELGSARNLADASVSRGIPAVLAMAEQIPDNVALSLTALFYRNLKLGLPVDMSLNRARQGLISSYGSNQFYWALPVLYLHPEFDGYLTAGDRSENNPADRLSLSPASYTPTLVRRESAPRTWPEAKAANPTVSSGAKPLQPSTFAGDGLELLETPGNPTDHHSITELVQQLTPSQTPAGAAVSGSESMLPAQTLNGVSPLSATATGRPATILPTELIRVEPPQTKPRRGLSRFLLLPLLGAASVALVYGLWRELPQFQALLRNLSAPVAQETKPDETAKSDEVDLSVPVWELEALATSTFKQEQPEQGIPLVEALLDQGALTEASVAIKAVPESLTNDPRINFLRGRLAWQGMKAKNGQHTVDQAADFWQQAAKADPENLDYQAALGFAYYTKGKDKDTLQTALETWNVKSTLMTNDPRGLIFEAGIALTLKKTATNYPPNQQSAYLKNAIQSYERVMKRAPYQYSPTTLRQNWLWTEEAVAEWEALGQLATRQ
jgi:tetratricopeptide (TPR) repeat protein